MIKKIKHCEMVESEGIQEIVNEAAIQSSGSNYNDAKRYGFGTLTRHYSQPKRTTEVEAW